MSMVRLIYFSEFRIKWEGNIVFTQLAEILEASRRNNAVNAITGALAFDSEWFVQVLEGSLDSVWHTYNRIESDPRHANIRFVEMVAVPSRRFGDWWMGCAERIAKHDALFAPYLYDGKFKPANMAGEMILSMMLDLSAGCFGQRSAREPVPA